jgi:hypothetical protein
MLLLMWAFSSCVQSDYTKLVKAELAKGIRKDSILLGINLGDRRLEFFGKCFDLNEEHLATQGPHSSVQYLFEDSLVHKEPTQIRLLFNPSFDPDGRIMEMHLEFSYTGWSPGNTQFQSDDLKLKVMELLMLWYKGNDFVVAKYDNTEVPVKLDANRRILVTVKDEQTVLVRVQDILHPQFKHSIETKAAE